MRLPAWEVIRVERTRFFGHRWYDVLAWRIGEGAVDSSRVAVEAGRLRKCEFKWARRLLLQSYAIWVAFDVIESALLQKWG